MVLELNNTVDTELASLENSVMYLAKKGRANGKDDPRFKELNDKVVASGKKIRNHAVEIRYLQLLTPLLIKEHTLKASKNASKEKSSIVVLLLGRQWIP